LASERIHLTPLVTGSYFNFIGKILAGQKEGIEFPFGSQFVELFMVCRIMTRECIQTEDILPVQAIAQEVLL
jgi:hypothetical protein